MSRLIDAEDSKLQTQLKIIREAEYQIYGSGSWGFTAKCERAINDAPTVQPEPHEIGYDECANALLKMWMDNVLSDWVYHRIIDKLNEKWGKTELPEPYKGVTK